MEALDLFVDEVLGFFSLSGLIDLIRSGNYDSLRTWAGLTKAISPLIPVIVIIELLMAVFKRRFHALEYRIPLLTYLFNRVAGRYISLGVIGFCIGWLQPIKLASVPLTWYGFIIGYIIWEFSHFIYHFLAHKVRLFWCLHSTHHAPERMNLSVTYTHFILEAPYADFIRTSICIFLGVDPVMLFAIMFVDGTWGGFIHVGENFMKDARFGFLRHIVLTPSHHRVHHARNPLYMDTNFCNLLNIWDHVFRTYQPEVNIDIQYGITRDVNTKNFLDVYFGEFYYLMKDVMMAPGLKNKILYVFMPPGWSHTGEHRTAFLMRQEFIQRNKQAT